MGQSIKILNTIRAEASQEFQNRIPVATQENIQAIGNALQTYTVLHNEFCDALLNKIGKTILETKLFKNKLARFKQGTVLSQQDVEEIFISMSKAEGKYDPTGPNPLGRREPPKVDAIYHRMNRQDYYVVSIGDVDFNRVFRSEATLDAFIAGLINSVYSGANYDEWLAMKNLLASYDGYTTVNVNNITYDSAFGSNFDDSGIVPHTLEGGSSYPDAILVHEENVKSFLRTFRKVIRDMSFPSEKFNSAGVMTWSESKDLVALVNKDLLAHVDVDVLSKCFHPDKADFTTEIIPMDDFGSMINTACLIIDKDFLRVYDTLSHFEPQRNAQGLFTNYFYHVHQILSASRFKNAVKIQFNTDAE